MVDTHTHTHTHTARDERRPAGKGSWLQGSPEILPRSGFSSSDLWLEWPCSQCLAENQPWDVLSLKQSPLAPTPHLSIPAEMDWLRPAGSKCPLVPRCPLPPLQPQLKCKRELLEVCNQRARAEPSGLLGHFSRPLDPHRRWAGCVDSWHIPHYEGGSQPRVSDGASRALPLCC